MRTLGAAVLSLGALSALAVAYGGWWLFPDGVCGIWWGMWLWFYLDDRRDRRPRWTEQDVRWLESVSARLPDPKGRRR